jgi:hypothetical protein
MNANRRTAILMLHSMFASFNELADAVENGDEKLNVLDEADRTALKKFWGEELVFRD